MGHGCGSSEGALCRLGDDVAGVTGFVDAVLFLGEVVAPVFVEVAVGVDGAEFEDGFGAVQAPAGAGDVHAVFDEVAAGALDRAIKLHLRLPSFEFGSRAGTRRAERGASPRSQWRRGYRPRQWLSCGREGRQPSASSKRRSA